jgi:two-component system CheB/CheR fusion protein
MRMVGAMTDITSMEMTEQKLRLKNEELQTLIQEFRFVTDFMPQMVWATRPDGYHDFYNKQWYDYTGLDYETTKDKGWSLVLHPDDFDRTWKVWRHSLNTGDFYEIEYRMRRYDGEYRWFLGRAIPLKDDAGNILKWFGTCTDIHDQKSISDVLEQKVVERTLELQKSNAELEDTNAELLQFASVASHDLKEPLRKIHMFSHIIKDRYLNEADAAAMDYLNRIINSSARMTKLINDLLSYSRLSVDSFFEQVNLNKVIEEVQSDLELFIQEKQATIKVGKLPEIDAIPGQLRQVFQNLIGNSLKFCRSDENPQVEISGEIIDQADFKASKKKNGKYVRITLKDNGIGFDAQYSSKIFTIFQRLHPREKYDGTGIGLAITKKIIDKHNGLIMAEGAEGKGSTFTIIFPIRQDVVNDESAAVKQTISAN